MKHFDVIVVGGGHAGVEAAHAAARCGARTALVTLKSETIGVMSCNPAMGGLGKGHLIREVDALDGLMGRVADQAGIQYRLLNRRKGPAVQGPRAQIDRAIYRAEMQAELARTPDLAVIEGEVSDLYIVSGAVQGVELSSGDRVAAPTVVLTTGTFLRGEIHIGHERRRGGRMGDKSSDSLAKRLGDLQLPLGRLKTGTPPRLDARSINWDILDSQPGDHEPAMLSFLSHAPAVRQVSCGITHTNTQTHDIIRENLRSSAMYGGGITGVGPRYCPSIEDKIVRFAAKESHQVFLEPEGLRDDTVYPNGISTSLPLEVQESVVRSMLGLENVRITQPGYAIEYDYIDPRALNHELELRALPGLYLAGQINGTTGYEEAAAQGVVAGLAAAAKSIESESVRLNRSNSYIGVMIDDLVTRGVTEPYRMFTSRAEYRLYLRADNADQRLTPIGMAAGCVGEKRQRAFSEKLERLEVARNVLSSAVFTPKELATRGFKINQDGNRRNGLELLAFPGISAGELAPLIPELGTIAREALDQLGREATYANYITRQQSEVAALKRDEAIQIPEEIDYFAISGLSGELQAKLDKVRPSNIAQAGRIEGMTPAALTLILLTARKASRAGIAV